MYRWTTRRSGPDGAAGNPGRAEIEAAPAEQGVRRRVRLVLLGRPGGDGPAVLLYHVRDLVCQQPQALGRVRRERLPAEEDVRADG